MLNLPDELLVGIVCCCSVQTTLQLRWTCQRWLSITDSDGFCAIRNGSSASAASCALLLRRSTVWHSRIDRGLPLFPGWSGNALLASASVAGLTDVCRVALSSSQIDECAFTEALRNACLFGGAQLMQLYLDDPRLPVRALTGFVDLACAANSFTVVRLLLQDERISAGMRFAQHLGTACEVGAVEVVSLLLQDSRVDPSFNFNRPLRTACRSGYSEVVRVLLHDSRVNVNAYWCAPLRNACEMGHVEVVRLLLAHPRLHARDEDIDAALLLAGRCGHEQVCAMLNERFHLETQS